MIWKSEVVSGAKVFIGSGCESEEEVIASAYRKLVADCAPPKTPVALRVEFWLESGKGYFFFADKFSSSNSSLGLCVVEFPRLRKAFEMGQEAGEDSLELYARTAMQALAGKIEQVLSREVVRSPRRQDMLRLGVFEGDDFVPVLETQVGEHKG